MAQLKVNFFHLLKRMQLVPNNLITIKELGFLP